MSIDGRSTDKSSHAICTWADGSSCSGCTIEGELLCRFDPKEVEFFVLNQVPYLVLAYFGMGLVGFVTGIWWPILVYTIAGLAFLGPVEMRILCSHCPYYAEDGGRLHCIAINPFPKLFSYRPEPLSSFEKWALISFALYLFSFPALVQAYGVWFLILDGSGLGPSGIDSYMGMAGVCLATVMAVLQLCYILARRFCARCVNLSCPFNRVPKPMAEIYLERNPAMMAAWDRESHPASPDEPTR